MFTRFNIVRFMLKACIVQIVLLAIVLAVLFFIVEPTTVALIAALTIVGLLTQLYAAMHLYDSSSVTANAMGAMWLLASAVPAMLIMLAMSASAGVYVAMFLIATVSFVLQLHHTAQTGGNAFLILHRNFCGAFRGTPIEEHEELPKRSIALTTITPG